MPLNISGEQVLCREVIPGKLYGVKEARKILSGNDISPGQHEFYYLKKGNNYEKTSFSAIKKEYNCSMKEGKGYEEKMKRCLQGK